ncbi:RNA polymerase sigma factor FliA [Methylicorpusculum oleiharenae]|uniref:RNA polymerase sigma factor FliA n=1 Tax=Methylicorpusculum oleiharenae TaxID=1338687 RepID=UPI00135CE195|nr:RNA polymerase sigma factor FliA [Methylicorpusculum oleiharenae]MCD2450714.1 RNA polymerase sigma factor FliA [Methylicorpusculum oleiharenae]
MKGAAMYASVQTGSKEDLVAQYAPLVKRIAYHLICKLPDTIMVDDLIQSGMLGLLEAVKNFDSSQGASFETYAGIRIRGSMLDDVRRSDWTPRSVHRKARMVADAIRQIENNTGCDARDSDVAKFLGISMDEYGQILQDTLCCRELSVEKLAEEGDHAFDECIEEESDPFGQISHESFNAALKEAIMQLPERERLVISLYYNDELNLREIGKVLEVSESRVSQILSKAMLRLRARLAGWQEAGSENT